MWVFFILVVLSNYDGEVEFRVKAKTEIGCNKLRKLIVSQFGGEENIKGSVTQCTLMTPLPKEPKDLP